MQTLSLYQHTAAATAAAERRAAAEHRRARRAVGAIALRRATPTDRAALDRLAQLDDADTPAGDVLLAELDGRLVAALPLDGGRPLADPFVRTQEIVDLLKVRASANAPSRARRLLEHAGLRHAA